MLWTEPCYMFYASIIGGLIGSSGVAFIMRKSHSEYLSRMEYYWNSDMKSVRNKLEELSTKKVDKVVNKSKNASKHRGYSAARHFDQRG